MEHTFNSTIYATRLPVIIAVIVLSYIFIKAAKTFLWKFLSEKSKASLTKLYDFFDPYHQGIFCYKYGWFSSFFIIALITVLCWYLVPPTYIYGEKEAGIAANILFNPISLMPVYVTHGVLGAELFCPISPKWFCYFSGNLTEIMIPFLAYLFILRFRGGIFFSPGILYWLSTALYHVGVEASNALAAQPNLDPSDAAAAAAAGIQPDWYYILKPLDLLGHAEVIGFIIQLAACVVFALAVYSCAEYVRRLLQKNISDIM